VCACRVSTAGSSWCTPSCACAEESPWSRSDPTTAAGGTCFPRLSRPSLLPRACPCGCDDPAEEWPRDLENSSPPPPRDAEESRAASVIVESADDIMHVSCDDAAACDALEEMCTDVCERSAECAGCMMSRRSCVARCVARYRVRSGTSDATWMMRRCAPAESLIASPYALYRGVTVDESAVGDVYRACERARTVGGARLNGAHWRRETAQRRGGEEADAAVRRSM
jgi:hypothetical protein